MNGKWVLVEDDEMLRQTLEEAMAARGFTVVACGTVKEAYVALDEEPAQGLIVDVVLPDGDAADVVEYALSGDHAPAIVAISGSASPQTSFRLGQLGVRAFLPKPIRFADLSRAVDEALSAPPDPLPHVRGAVGHVPIFELEASVREAMLDEALARTGGNRSKAAELLGVSRQVLQYMLKQRG